MRQEKKMMNFLRINLTILVWTLEALLEVNELSLPGEISSLSSTFLLLGVAKADAISEYDV